MASLASHVSSKAKTSNAGWCVAGGVAVGVAGTLLARYVASKLHRHGSAKALANVTETHFQYPRDTRREERWPEDSPEYKAGHARHNRVKPPPDEVEGDIFDRQRCIVGFNQGAIEKQVCFVLGTGGIGQNVALTLARLGVGKIIMLDCDTYDASNLTRQCLGSKADIGRRKVDAAADNIRHHNLRSEIETVHCDALTDWATVVSIARRSTVIFNGVDLGPMWDFCVNALGRELGIPTVAGQSYDWLWDTEFYSNKPGARCQACKGSKSFEAWLNSYAVHFGAKEDRDRTAMLRRMFPSPSTTLAADAIAAFLRNDPNFRMDGPTLQAIIASALRDALTPPPPAGAGPGAGAGAAVGARAVSVPHHRRAAGAAAELTLDTAPAFFSSLHRRCLARMLPGAVSRQHDLRFIPRPHHVDTRFVGSWVCVCLAASVHMVSQWVAALFAEDNIRNDLQPPSSFTMILGQGKSGAEQGYHEELQFAKMGVLPVTELLKVPKTHYDDASDEFCGMCQAGAGRSIREVVPLPAVAP